MDAELTQAEIKQYREILPADNKKIQEALDILADNNGRIDAAFDELWIEKNGRPPTYDMEGFRKATIKVLRQELCGDNDSFRTKIQEYSKKPGSTPLLTGLIVYLVGMAGLPIDPAIATVIVLYILKVGLNIFCEYTASPPTPTP